MWRDLDLAPVLRALGAVQAEGQPEGVVSLITADVEHLQTAETFARSSTAATAKWRRCSRPGTTAKPASSPSTPWAARAKPRSSIISCRRSKASGWRGARSIFAWSFYSQGWNEDRQTSADDFFKAAYQHFGGKDAAPPRDPHRRAWSLAHLVQAQRSLLILDGLEPLQYAAGAAAGARQGGRTGGIKDPGIKSLLKLLADEQSRPLRW